MYARNYLLLTDVVDSIAINGVHDESRLRGLELPSLRRK